MSLFKETFKAFTGILLTIAIVGGIVVGIYKWVNKDKIVPDLPSSITVNVMVAEIPDTVPTDLETTPSSELIHKTGLVQAGQEVVVYPEVTARILSMSVKEGQSVIKGQKLAVLGDSAQMRTAESAYRSASALLNNAQATLATVSQANEINMATYGNQIRNAELTLIQARNQLQSAGFIRYEQQGIQDTKDLLQTMSGASLFGFNFYGSAKSEEDLYSQYLQQQLDDRQKSLTEYQGRVQDQQNILQIESAENQLNLLIKQLDLNTVKSRLDIINTQNQIIQLRQQLESAQISLQSGVVTSPISGVISKSAYGVGATVGPQTALFTVTDLGNVSVETSLSPEEYFRITEASQVETLIKIVDKTVPATISYIGVSADSVSKTIPMKVEPGVLDTQIRRRFIPNTFAKLEFIINKDKPEQDEVLPENDDLFSIPVIALKFEEDGIKVALAVDGEVRYRAVKLAPPIRNGMVKIASGLQSGDLIILETTDLPEGAKVTPNIIE